jgi:predicted transposase YbfD/YdcC
VVDNCSPKNKAEPLRMTEETHSNALMQAFDDLPDPRTRQGRCQYPLQELLLTALCAVAAGAQDWVDVATWGQLKLEWLRRFLQFEQDVASHDTFSRVFAMLDAVRFEACFRRWMAGLCPNLAQAQIAVDGKTLRGSGTHEGQVHLVSAWHCGAGVTLGQVKTQAKSNEITAIPELLDGLELRGATITIDSMGCQKAIVQQIIDEGADYIIGVKNNQPNLAQAVQTLLEQAPSKADGRTWHEHSQTEKGHGRIEIRRCVVCHDLSAIATALKDWAGVRSVVLVESIRQDIRAGRFGKRSAGEAEPSWRYYISSQALDAQHFNAAIRAHWAIENGCHWVMDVNYREDECLIRRNHGPQNMATLRRMAQNQIKQDVSKGSQKVKRKRMGWSDDYLQELFGLVPQAPIPQMGTPDGQNEPES